MFADLLCGHTFAGGWRLGAFRARRTRGTLGYDVRVGRYLLAVNLVLVVTPHGAIREPHVTQPVTKLI